VFFVRTLDEDGRSSAASAFVVGSDSNRSYLVTSYEAVKAATREPGPAITLTATDREIEATLWQWEESTDMAVLTVDDPDLPVLPWASQELARNPIGTRIYAGGGLGSQGASVSPGLVIDVSAVGLQHTAAVGTAYRGGPLLTGNGEVLGMVSVDYAPLNFEPGAVTFAPNIVAACNGLLDCTGRIPTLENTEEDAEGEGEEDGEGEPADETDTEG
jgi:S1-C subfamily serine protease